MGILTKKKCEDCKNEKSRLNSIYNDKTGGFDFVCMKCAKKRMAKQGFEN